MKQTKTTVRNQQWSNHLRSRVGDSVSYLDAVWTNITGKNSEPGVGNDWLFVSSEAAIITYSNDFTYVNGDPQTFTLPLGVIPKSVYHNRTLLIKDEYSVTGAGVKTVSIDYVVFDPDETNIITIKN